MMKIEELINLMVMMIMLFTAYAFSKNHVMNNLIIIEFLVISISMTMFYLINLMKMENFLVIYFLVTSISESVLGLSILISLIRTHGNDFLKSSLILKL